MSASEAPQEAAALRRGLADAAEALTRLQRLARALLDEFGGNVPDWLRAAASALETELNDR